MKNIILTVLMLFIASGIVVCQFKSQAEYIPSVAESMLRQDGGGLMFGCFDPSKFTMRNSYSLSYTTSGGKGYSLGAFTSSLAYQISNPLSVQFDVSLLHSPFNNLGGNFTNNISGIYLTRAALNYQPSKNTLLQIQYRQLPAMYWQNNYNRFGFMSGFDMIDDEEFR